MSRDRIARNESISRIRVLIGMARVASVAIVSVLFTNPVSACESQFATLFSCGTGLDASEGGIALCGIEHETLDEYVGVQFRLDAGDRQVVYPSSPRDNVKDFASSMTKGPDGYLIDVRFSDGETGYRLYSLEVPRDPAVPDDLGAREAGVVIEDADGTLTRIACTERVFIYIGYMREAMQCDHSNPLGAAACDPDNIPERNSPLGREAGAPLVID